MQLMIKSIYIFITLRQTIGQSLKNFNGYPAIIREIVQLQITTKI